MGKKSWKGKELPGLGLLVPYTVRLKDFSSMLCLDPIILLSADASREPLLPLSLRGCMREGPGIQSSGSQGTPTSFSSASSSDGDLDFRSPRSSQGQRLGKGELVQPEVGVLWEGIHWSLSTIISASMPEELGVPKQKQTQDLSWQVRGVCCSSLAQKGQDNGWQCVLNLPYTKPFPIADKKKWL